MLAALDRAATDIRDRHTEAIEDQNWRGGFEHLLTSLIWRAIAQSIRLGLASPQFNPADPAFGLSRRLRRDLETALCDLPNEAEPSSGFQKAHTLAMVLDGLIDAVGVLEAWTGLDPQEPFFLAVRAVNLGQAEAGLSLIEQGHWEEVARWRDRQVGRRKGYQQPWRVKAAPVIQEWIDADPHCKRTALMQKLWNWLEAEAARDKDFHPPQSFESLRAALTAMEVQMLIRFPPKIRK